MAGFLDQMAAGSRARADAAVAREPLAAVRARCADSPSPPALTLGGGFDVIAELKLRSPALGALGRVEDGLVERVRAYAAGGAAAVSVLTEPDRFDGSLGHLAAAASALAPLGVPAMRKDFLVDPYQLYEARAAGAGGALLIIRMLSRDALGEMLDCARELGLFVLLEAFDEQDLAVAAERVSESASRRGRDPAVEAALRPGSGRGAPRSARHPPRPPRPQHEAPRQNRAVPNQALPHARAGEVASGPPERARLSARATWGPGRIPAAREAQDPDSAQAPDSSQPTILVGVNCRDLQTLEVVPSRFAALAGRLPAGVPRVAESGLESAADVEAAVRAGYDVALIGGALMRSGDPRAALEALLAAGRRAAA